MDVPILQTKLYIPLADPAELIARPHLTQRLNEGLTRKLTLISAPAGSGKTTLVSQWLSHFRWPTPDFGLASTQVSKIQNRKSKIVNRVAWLSLDEGDNDPVRFWTYVIAALDTVQPGIGATTLPLLRSPQPAPPEVALTFLLNDLATLPTKVALVLDDYHLIENTAIHDAVTLLLDRLPPQMHLVLTSRVAPPLPLARWRVKRQLTELRAEALRFSQDETDLFLNHLSGLNLTVQQIATLEGKTEGWVAGLQLAALALHDRRDIESFITTFTGSYRYILDYMTEEILHRQPESVQSFLLQTAILERLNGSLCDAVTGRADGQRLLEQLGRANLFIIALDDQGYWYRYHHLFAELLRHHLQQRSSPFAGLLARELKGDVQELHRRAASWYEGAGLAEEAISHTLVTHEYQWASRLILSQAETRLALGEVMLLRRWLQTLPEAWLRSQLQLNLLQAWLLYFTGQFDELQQRLPEIEQAWHLHQIDPVEPLELFSYQEIPGLIAGLQAAIALLRGETRQAIELSQQALAQLGHDKLGLRSVIAHTLAKHRWLHREAEKAGPLPANSGETTTSSKGSADLTTLGHRAELKVTQGQYRQAIAIYQRILQVAAASEKPGEWLMSGVAHSELGLLLYEANELAAAETHARQGLKLGQQGAGAVALFVGYVGLTLVLLVQENFPEALETIQQLEQLAQNLDSSVLSSLAALLQMNLSLAQGDLTAVAQWQQASGMGVNDELVSTNALLYRGLARILVARGELDQATALLARLIPFFETAHWTEGLIRTLPIQAIAFQAQNKLELALITLQRALTLAEPELYIRTFVDLGAPMATLLLELLDVQRQGQFSPPPSSDYINRLLAAFDFRFSIADLPKTAGSLEPNVVESPYHQEEDLQLGLEIANEPETYTAQPGTSRSSAEPALPVREMIQNLVEPLTGRELEVLQLLGTGLSGQEIADKLVISRGTLKTHLKRIYDKLQVNSRAQAVEKGKDLNLL
jgi:LuxR family maltose regulon positive regulatory protein